MKGLEKAIATVKALRGENGCPWDKEQTHQSLRTYLLEETHEVLEAIDELSSKGSENLQEELGDLLLQVLLHAEIASEAGAFSLDSLADSLAEKLIRRHPHVFGDKKLSTSDQVLSQWEKTKKEEKKGRESVLDGIPAALPALQKSLKVIDRVSRVGFQWKDIEGPLAKMEEELREFQHEVKKLGSTRAEFKAASDSDKQKIESEMGDLLFTVANVSYFLELNPENALRAMLLRFEKRFRHVEKRAKEMGKKLEEMKLEEMDILWDEAKKLGL